MSSNSVDNQSIEPTSTSEILNSNGGTAATRRYQTRSLNHGGTTMSTSTDSKISQKRKAGSITSPPSKIKAGTAQSSSKEIKPTKSTKAPKKALGKGRGTRITDKHILFWGGVLSNWNVGNSFSGKRVVELLVPRLAEQGAEHPSITAISTKLLEHHDFVCGEQAMMAFKAWLFERDPVLEQEVAEVKLNVSDFDSIFNAILGPSHLSKIDLPDHLSLNEILAKARKTYLCQILRNPNPRDQKALGRKVPHFSPETWGKSCVPIVVSASIARAESEEDLKKLYLQAGDRNFVEGSPMDRIWGVGLKWDDPRADVEENWRGRNLLGKCHDQAAAFLKEVDA